MLLLEQDTTKKEYIDKNNAIKLNANENNMSKYKVEII